MSYSRPKNQVFRLHLNATGETTGRVTISVEAETLKVAEKFGKSIKKLSGGKWECWQVTSTANTAVLANNRIAIRAIAAKVVNPVLRDALMKVAEKA